MDLLLTHGYFLREDERERQIMKPYVPLGILYICSHLRARGFDVQVFDSTFCSKQELYDALAQGPPSVLGIYTNLMTRPNVVEIIRAAKANGWKTIVGGPEAGTYAAEYLASGADIAVSGEGELTLEELLPALKGGASLESIPGIAYRDAVGEVRRTGTRAQISNIDAQPWPARDAVDIQQYVNTWRKHHGTGSVSIITARGCPYHCRWCSHQVFGKTHRRRKPESVAEELAFLIDRYAPDMAWMADDVFTIHHGWLFEYAAELKKRGIHLPFECISRADRMNERVVDTLAQMGCFRVWIGSESGSQRILDAMERGVTVEQVQQAIALCKSRGIQTGMFLMWGYEGEEIEDIEATIAHVKTTNPDMFLTTVSYPIRGTEYFARIEERVEPTGEWANSSDRSFRIRGRHSRKFYTHADELLRDEVERTRRGEDPMLLARIKAERQAMLATASEVEG